MTKSKKLSNPISTGGGGHNFEGHVQASFIALMLTGGYAPCLPTWPITEVKLQGKVEGFDTDDFIVVVENEKNKERRKLLAQIKHSISITEQNPLFGEVIQAAWNDFKKPKVFSKGKDIIALITGPLSKTDSEVVWLLNHARSNRHDSSRFFRDIATANFSSNTKRKKLSAFRRHLVIANGGVDVADNEFHEFLKSFYLLGYDLGEEEGVVLSLINSHISQFKPESERSVWSRILEFTNNMNQHAGCISDDNLPEDLKEVFIPVPVSEIPANLATRPQPAVDWAQHPDAIYLAYAVLIGSWNEKKESDVAAVAQFMAIDYDLWLQKAREILHSPDSPLSVKNGIWKVANRAELWDQLGSRVLDQDLDNFKSLAVTILSERNPAFDLPVEERYAANIHGKVLEHSETLRKGIAEGLAILSSRSEACSYCSQGKAESTSLLAVRGIFDDADWVLWGSLNDLLPSLAEAAPGEFLEIVETALALKPSPFDDLFAQEGDAIIGGNYLTGLLWALETLAWDEHHFVRVCVALGDLATHDPGGQWANRPGNSLITILLPWLPQTLASIEKRLVAVKTLLNEHPDVAWKLLIQLLPDQVRTSSGSHKPSWRKIIPDDWEKGVTHREYWEQVTCYSELAVNAADSDPVRLSELASHFDSLSKPAFDKLIEILSSKRIIELPEDRRLLLWEKVRRFASKHRQFSEAKWALPDELLVRIESVADMLAPTDSFNLYQHLFANNDHDLYEEKGNWEEQRKKLDARREQAIAEILQQTGIEGVIRFADAVISSDKVGQALGAIGGDVVEHALLPHFLDEVNDKRKALASGFTWKRYYMHGWEWCDNIDKSGWSPGQIGQFLACLPFTKEAWDRASEWLKESEREYWSRTYANAYQAKGGLSFAIDKLVEYGRPHSAIDCLDKMRHDGQLIDTEQCVRTLLAALSSSEPPHAIESYHIVELIKWLQATPSVTPDQLFRVEWAYLPLLEHDRGAAPKHLECRLASDPEFFCEIIRLIYRSKNEKEPTKEPSEETKKIATNAWRLLHEWQTPPGLQNDETFSEEHFNKWLNRVKELCIESGHIEAALIHIGEVLIHTPSDPSELWIHRAVASALNDRDAEDMRRGFSTGTYNARGVHWVDPTGKPEKELAEQFRRKADDVENAGFQRFAVTLRDLADGYEREAERIIGNSRLEED